MSAHAPKAVADNEEDPLEKLMKHTGCLPLHYKVQECIAETQDWRKCKEQVMDFKRCMDDYNRRKRVK